MNRTKRLICIIIIYILLIFIIPSAVVYFFRDATGTRPGTYTPVTIKSYISDEDKVEEFPLEEYLVGVVAAEMPASFPEEALKAQAVAARTFIVSRSLSDAGDVPEHKGAVVCTNPAHCKAWRNIETLKSGWGEKAEEYEAKIKNAVASTEGKLILYEGKPISAVYYSMSSGNTENSADVWGGDLPYLKSVNSSFDSKAPGFASQAAFTPEEFKRVILTENPKAVLGDDPSLWVGQAVTSEGGGVMTIKIGGELFKGTRLRTLFSLRSHCFTLSYTDGVMLFEVKGYGHGVGMSQWGSRFLAEEGKTYTEILKYYYTGVEIV